MTNFDTSTVFRVQCKQDFKPSLFDGENQVWKSWTLGLRRSTGFGSNKPGPKSLGPFWWHLTPVWPDLKSKKISVPYLGDVWLWLFIVNEPFGPAFMAWARDFVSKKCCVNHGLASYQILFHNPPMNGWSFYLYQLTHPSACCTQATVHTQVHLIVSVAPIHRGYK